MSLGPEVPGHHGRMQPASLREVTPGDPAVWQPQSYAEWEARERTQAFLAAWIDQMGHERSLRSLAARVVFSLIGAQVLGVFTLLVLQGTGVISLDHDVLKVVVPSVLADVFGLGFVVTKYLFSVPLRSALDTLAMRNETHRGT